MDLQRLKKFQFLEMLAQEPTRSQREFSKRLEISLGMVNAFIKRLVTNGHCTVTALPGNRTAYVLTPAGMMEKTRLSYEYITISYQYFKQARSRLKKFFADLESNGTRRVIFYGAGELGQIAWRVIQHTQIQCVDVVDPSMVGEPFAGFIVNNPSQLRNRSVDGVLVTVANDHETAIRTIEEAGIPREKILFLGLR